MIEKIEINNFRGIKSGKIDRFRQFNLLVGPNNSGKSAVLEALYLASTATRFANLTVQDRKIGIKTYPISVTAPDLLEQSPLKECLARHNFYKPSEANHLRQGILKVQIANHPIKRFEIAPQTDEYLSHEEVEEMAILRLEENGEASTQPLVQKLMQEQSKAQGDAESQADLQENQHLLFCWHRDLTYYHQGSASWLITGTLAPAHHTFFADISFTQKNMSRTFIQRNLSTVPGWTHQIAKHFARILDIQYPFAVQFLPTGEFSTMQGWISPADNLALPIDVWGDGARAVFKLLTPLIALANHATEEAPGIVLWEEPELFQNPKTLDRLLREVVHIVQGKPIQIFMVSHNLEVVAHLTKMLQEGQISEDDTIAFLLNLQEGELQSTWFAANNLISWLESGLDPRVWDHFSPPVQFRVTTKEEEE